MLTSGELFNSVQQGFGKKRIALGVIHIDTAPKSIKSLTSVHVCGRRDGSYACKKCGITPSIIVKWRHINEPEWTVHTDMFHIGKNGNGGLRMMTVDHILPKSGGGTDRKTNLEIMCQSCNTRKGNHLSDEQLITIIDQLDLHLGNTNKLMSFIVCRHPILLSIPDIDLKILQSFEKLSTFTL